MPVIVTFVQNQRENQVLTVIFESYGYDVVELAPTTNNFLQAQQCSPKAIIMELPQIFDNQLELVSRFRSNGKTKSIPILAFGDHSDSKVISTIQRSGIENYTERPLQTDKIQEIVQPITGKRLTLHTKEQQQYEGELEDTLKILNPKTSAIARIDIMVNRIGELLAFPFTIAKVLSVTQSASTGAQELARAIEVDPVIVSSVLKVANSAFYSAANRSSGTMGIRDAIVRIGFNETKNIAISMSVMKMFTDDEKSVGFSREDFWFHSLATAVIASQLAKQANYSKPEFAFVSALLHDFGVILMDEFYPQYLKKTLQLTNKRGESFLKVQKEKWGMTHNDVVKRLFSEWNMPTEVLEVITNFDSYRTYRNSVDSELVTLVQIVGVSNHIAKSLQLGRECDEFITEIPNDILTNLRVIGQFNESFLKKISTELTMFSSHLGLNTPPISFSKTPAENEVNHKICFSEQTHHIFNTFENYLYAQKNSITYVDSIDDVKELEISPDIVVIHADKNQEVSEFDEIFALEKKVKTKDDNCETEDKNTQPTEDHKDQNPLPVLIIGGIPYKDELQLPVHVVQISNKVDLRVLSFAIDSLIIGHQFTLRNGEEPDIESELPNEINATKLPDDNIPIVKPFSYKTRVVENSAVVIELHGTVKTDKFKDLINIMITLLNKTPYLGIDFTHTTDVPLEFYILIENFKKVVQAKNGKICSFYIDIEEIKEHINRDYISIFKEDTELIKHLNINLP